MLTEEHVFYKCSLKISVQYPLISKSSLLFTQEDFHFGDLHAPNHIRKIGPIEANLQGQGT